VKGKRKERKGEDAAEEREGSKGARRKTVRKSENNGEFFQRGGRSAMRRKSSTKVGVSEQGGNGEQGFWNISF